jgi:flagellar basal-body rod protein FlgC
MSLFNVMSVSASGLAAQRARAQAIVENLANAETTRTPEGGPYRRKDVIFAPEAQGSPFSSIFAPNSAPPRPALASLELSRISAIPSFAISPAIPTPTSKAM